MSTRILCRCLHCGKKVYKSARRVAEAKLGVFCDRKCFSEYITGPNHPTYLKPVKRKCERCGDTFKMKSRDRISRQKFCSQTCAAKRGKESPRYVKRKKAPCPNCGKILRLVKRLVKLGRCCSRGCADKLHSKRMKGAGNSNYAHGQAERKYKKKFYKLREKVRRREKRRCFLCRKKELNGYSLSVHHIDYDKDNNRMDNFVAVCKRCHAKMHGSRLRKRLRWARKLFRMLSRRYDMPPRSITLKSLRTTITLLKES